MKSISCRTLDSG